MYFSVGGVGGAFGTGVVLDHQQWIVVTVLLRIVVTVLLRCSTPVPGLTVRLAGESGHPATVCIGHRVGYTLSIRG